MEYVYLGEGEDGLSYFEDREIPLGRGDFAPPAQPMPISGPVACEQVVFLELPPGWTGKRHPSPRKQVGVLLSGRIRVTAGSGESREMGPGGIWWMEDTKGEGHVTEVLGDETVKMAITQLC